MKVSIAQLDKLVYQILRATYAPSQAKLIKEVVMFGELSGKKSHGLIRLFKENYGVFVEGIQKKPQVIHKTSVSSLIESNGNPGMLIGPMAMFEVMKLAKRRGIGIVGSKGSINSTGSLTYYSEKLARENLISMIFTQSSPMMAPFSSKKALFGTNPLAFGFPASPQPIIFDMATSAMTFGAIAQFKAQGKKLPENVAIDSRGSMTVDPVAAMDGAILAFDNSYKGSGLALIVEMLGGMFSGASFAGLDSNNGWGNLYIAISPDLLSDVSTFKKNTKRLISLLQNTETSSSDPIRIPGHRSLKTRDLHVQNGFIEIDDELYEKLLKLSKK